MTSLKKAAHGCTAVRIISVTAIALLLYLALGCSGELAELVRDGLYLSASVIIPPTLPFIVLCDPIRTLTHPEDIRPLGYIFERLFNINRRCVGTFILGLVCGFPIGAKMALECYDNGIVSKDECERLMAISNNASPAYVISAVGISLRGSEREGVILYFSAILSSIICGVVISFGKSKTDFSAYIPRQSYSFVESVKSAVHTCLSVSGFVTVFYVIFGCIELISPSEALTSLVGSVLEISGGTRYISESDIFPSALSFGLCSFCISFSGLCIAAQTVSLIKKDSGVRPSRYLLYKLLSGVISFIISIILFLIFT